MINKDPGFQYKLDALVRKLAIEERYQTLKAVEEAVRQYLPISEFWYIICTGEYKCRMKIRDVEITLTILKGSSGQGRESVTLKDIAIGVEEIPESCMAIPLYI